MAFDIGQRYRDMVKKNQSFMLPQPMANPNYTGPKPLQPMDMNRFKEQPSLFDIRHKLGMSPSAQNAIDTQAGNLGDNEPPTKMTTQNPYLAELMRAKQDTDMAQMAGQMRDIARKPELEDRAFGLQERKQGESERQFGAEMDWDKQKFGIGERWKGLGFKQSLREYEDKQRRLDEEAANPKLDDIYRFENLGLRRSQEDRLREAMGLSNEQRRSRDALTMTGMATKGAESFENLSPEERMAMIRDLMNTPYAGADSEAPEPMIEAQAPIQAPTRAEVERTIKAMKAQGLDGDALDSQLDMMFGPDWDKAQ